MPNGVAGPGNVLPSPSNRLVLAPISGLMKREDRSEASSDWPRRRPLDHSDDIQIKEPCANDRREIERLFGRLMFFIVYAFPYHLTVKSSVCMAAGAAMIMRQAAGKLQKSVPAIRYRHLR